MAARRKPDVAQAHDEIAQLKNTLGQKDVDIAQKDEEIAQLKNQLPRQGPLPPDAPPPRVAPHGSVSVATVAFPKSVAWASSPKSASVVGALPPVARPG